jgi:hypothetical protein
MSRTFRIRHLPRLEIAVNFAWSTNEFSVPWNHQNGCQERPGPVPILSPHYHPWVRYRANLRANVFYRRVAHKTIRKTVKHLLNRSQVDFDEMLMPLWREYFDTWHFT